MVVKNLYQPFEIVYKELDECPGAHKHNFFELIYIVDGTGTHCINKNIFHYKAGHFFLATPSICHSFNVATTTKFFLVRFNDIYLKAQQTADNTKDWIQKLEYIFHNNTHLPGCILKNQGDKVLVRSLVESIIREEINKEFYYKELVQQIINTMLTIVVRNISLTTPEKVKAVAPGAALNIVEYIHQHIYSPELLRTEKIASHFSISLNYLGEYFKKHTGESMQQYITNYKLKLVETRLLHSDLRIGEIAVEMGFTDESHLNRIFKKYYGYTPSAYRKKETRVMHSVMA